MNGSRHLATRAVIALAFALTGVASAFAQHAPTADEYVTNVVGEAWIVAAGELVLDGHKVSCGQTLTVLHDRLDDYGAAFPGFIILNPRRLEKVSTAVKLWSYAHECGHQVRGPDEETADCFAVQHGRRQGWLTQQGLEEICHFIAPAEADRTHIAGPMRCELMRACYAHRSVATRAYRDHRRPEGLALP